MAQVYTEGGEQESWGSNGDERKEEVGVPYVYSLVFRERKSNPDVGPRGYRKPLSHNQFHVIGLQKSISEALQDPLPKGSGNKHTPPNESLQPPAALVVEISTLTSSF